MASNKALNPTIRSLTSKVLSKNTGGSMTRHLKQMMLAAVACFLAVHAVAQDAKAQSTTQQAVPALGAEGDSRVQATRGWHRLSAHGALN